MSWRALRSATLCLLNRERTKRGLRPLRLDRRLSRAARLHARDMVRHRYFEHTSLSGASFVTRIRRTGYMRRGGRWLVGENIAWGSGRLSPPEAVTRALMNSPHHRDNILCPSFREVGISVVGGAPVVQQWPDPATYVTDFGALHL